MKFIFNGTGVLISP